MKRVMSDIEIGRRIAQFRDSLTQAELANRMRQRLPLGQSVISRIESGERPASDEELEAILSAIGTDDAREFNAFRLREWDGIRPPSFENPDRELLWRANTTLRASRELRLTRDIRASLDRQLSSYENELQKFSQLLLESDYRVAFVGSIGVGKTTVICSVCGLETEGSPAEPVLEVGSGGITICEVHVTEGPQYGLLVHPLPYERVVAHVRDFCDYLTAHTENDDMKGDDGESLGLSHEVQRAIRNMTGLTVRRHRRPDGRRVSHDLARELAARYRDAREFQAQVLALIRLERRDRNNIWYSRETGKPPLLWLRETFASINNGRHPDFSLPERIDLVVPTLALDASFLKLRIIDTKGIDETAARADLESLFDDAKTVIVLCSTFNEAPQSSLQLLLERALQSRVADIRDKVSLLVLPRAGEALAAKDESGTQAQSDQDGYDLKGEQIALTLAKLALRDLKVEFFNAMRDSRERARAFLVDRVFDLRSRYRHRVEQLIDAVQHVIANYENAQVIAVIEDAAAQLRIWADSNVTLEPPTANLHSDLIEAITSTHASTVRASVRREGDWLNLDFWHHLGSSARRFAGKLLIKKVHDLQAVAENLMANPEYHDARQLIARALQTFQDAVDELLARAQLYARTLYSETVKKDKDLWAQCESEWGMGPGYRNRVARHNKNWFEDASHVELAKKIASAVAMEWAKVVGDLRRSLEYGPTASGAPAEAEAKPEKDIPPAP